MQWKALKSATHKTSVTFDADVLADDKYCFRVVASDRETNSPSAAPAIQTARRTFSARR
jgi:hypothetical protein